MTHEVALAEDLIGVSRGRPGSDETRVTIEIHDGTRDRLVALLHQPYMRAVGYSEFIERAIACAYAQQTREEQK